MYYVKFTNGQLISTTDNYYDYIQISNNVAVFYQKSRNTSKYADKITIITEYVLKDNELYLPLQKINNMYYVLFSQFITDYEIDFTQKIPTYDDNFVFIKDLYFFVTSSKIVVLENPNDISTGYSPTSTTSYASSKFSTYTMTATLPSGYSGWSGVKEIGLSTIISEAINKANILVVLGTSGGYIFRNYVYKGMHYDSNFEEWIMGTNESFQYCEISNPSDNFNILSYAYGLSGSRSTYYPSETLLKYKFEYGDVLCSACNTELTNPYALFIKNDIENLEIYSIDKPNYNKDMSVSRYYQRTLLYIPQGDGKYFDTTKSYYIILQNISNTSYFSGNYYTRADNGQNALKMYQEPYTPTNKLTTLTFSDLKVEHNEESGTFALTFKLNNPNSVSVSTNIHCSGRDEVEDITAPSGTSEWSFLLKENSDGTIQATDISALGYENADDSAVYKYLKWVEPGYLRELAISSVFLSTINDKDYTLNVYVDNNNSVSIPAVLHYGKTSELTKSITLKSGLNTIYVSNVENVNGSVWIHPEKVDGYYQLPDTDAVSYTKLPIPPVPSSTGITLFKNNNNNKVVNKGYKLETYKVLNGTFRDEVNILNPIFQITNDEVPDCNYCYIADFRRYYYIDTITCVRTGLYELQCSVDVLYTYKDNILTSEQYISRQENEYNELLVDNMVTFDSDHEYTIEYQNIDELDYGIDDTKSTSQPSQKVNLIVTWYKTN